MKNYCDVETEREVVGSLLMDSSGYLEVFDILSEEDFSDEPLGALYRVFLDQYEKDLPLDLRTLVQKANVRLELVVECMDVGCIQAIVKNRAKKLADLSRKRKVVKGCQEILVNMVNMENQEIAEKLTTIAGEMTASTAAKKVYSANELCKRVIEVQEERMKDPGIIRGVQSYFPILDNTVRGFRPKRMTVIAAATGFGKSTLALNLFHQIRQHNRPLFISNENDVDDNLDRLCGITTRMDVKQVEGGTRYKEISEKFVMNYKDKTAFLSDNSPRNIEEVCGVIHRHVIQHQVDIVFLDYIGEVSGDPRDRESEEAKLSRYTQRLLDCVKSAGVHLFLMTQLNREGNKKGRPQKTELAGCFKIAMKAHSLLLFWKDENGQDVLTVDKNRQGPPGVDIAVEYDRNNQTIREQGYWNSERGTIIPMYEGENPYAD